MVKEQFPLRHLTKLAYWVLVEARLARGASRVWYSSSIEQRHSRGVFPGMPATQVVVPFASRDLGSHDIPPVTDAEPLRLVTAARVTPVKDLDVLLHALAQSPRWSLDVAGDQAEPYAEELRALADELGVADRVRWRGYLPPDELDDLVRSRHAYACPGLESFGMAVAEALSADVPVIVSDAVALAPLVERSGRVFARRDVEGLRRALAGIEAIAERGVREGVARSSWQEACSPEAFRAAFEERITPLRRPSAG